MEDCMENFMESLSLNDYPFEVTKNGVFAKRDIERGEYVCFYPIDAILIYGDWKFNGKEFKINKKHNIEFSVHLKNTFNCPLDPRNDELKEKIVDYFGLAEEHYGRKCTNSCIKLDCFGGTTNDSFIDKDGVGHLINDSSSKVDPLKNHQQFIDESKEKQNVSFDTMLKKYGNGNTNGLDRYGLDIYAEKNIPEGNELFLFYNDFVQNINETSVLGIFSSKVAKEFAEKNNIDMKEVVHRFENGSGKNGRFTKKDLIKIMSSYGSLSKK